MNRLERIIVGIFISLACAASFFIAGWWICAGLSIYRLLPVTDQEIATVAFSGLGLGIFLDALCLRRRIAGFYDVDWRLAAPIYLYWVMIATASFMGVPVGTLVLGTLAGLYLGCRYRHAGTSTVAFASQARTASLVVALVTGIVSLGIGILALREVWVLADIQKIVGTGPGSATLVAGAGIVLVLCAVLVALQYRCTSTAATLAFRLGRQT